jgi:ABC-type lipoprotein release transport system permease subunit
MSAVAFRFRCELRRRWRAWLALAILVGAAAGGALMLFAGSRRTGSAHERFRSAQHAFDVGLQVVCRPGAANAEGGDTNCFDVVGRLPAVAEVTTVTSLPAFVETLDGRSIQPNPDDPCDSEAGTVEVAYDASGRYGTTINRSRFVAGRPANVGAADEVVLSQDTANRLHLRPGSELRIRLFAGADCGDAPEMWRAPARVRVVGVQLSPAEVRPPSGSFLQTVRVTPAFVRRAGAVPGHFDYLAVRLRPEASIAALRTQARTAGYEVEVAVSQANTASAVERAIRPNQVSLEILAALTAFAAIAVLGQILIRQTYVESDDDALLSALGMRTRERVMLASLRGATVGLGAAAVAVVTAIAASPLMPVGLARRLEPFPGFSVDGAVLAIGALLTLLFVAAVTAVTAARLATRGDREMSVKRATLANFAAGAGFSPAAVSGARLALERGVGTRAVPVASSFAGLTIAVVAVVGSLTFGAGLTHLQTTPRLVGWNWDVAMTYPQLEDSNAMSLVEARSRIERTFGAHGIDDFAKGTLWSPFPQGRDLQVGPDHIDVGGFIAFDGSARVGPSVISGRKPSQADEIMLGPRTISTLGLHVGNVVDVIGQKGTWEAPGEETSTRMRIVGTGLAPMTESLGRGAVVTLEGLRRLSPDATEQAWFVRVPPGSDRAAVVDAYCAGFPRSMRASIESFGIERFELSALNLEQIKSVPVLFAIIMGLMAAAVLAHVLAVASRARRRDMAVLRALGFSRGQTLRTVAWQSTIYSAGALAVGCPLGLLLGRLAWRTYAVHLGAVPEATTPLVACAAVVVSALALGCLLAITPAWRSARTPPGVVLRTE